ncbi:MAG: hypothetical protein RL065_1946 [Bacteroidota bacterium]|jgi:hypothetical protein
MDSRFHQLFYITLLSLLSFLTSCKYNTDKKLVVKSNFNNNKYNFYVLNSSNDTVFKSDKYWICFDDTFENFMIVAPKDRDGFWAIDLKENYLFEVYNRNDGEPYPDRFRNNRIRIVDKNNKIGFADKEGKIVIQPQFEQATYFKNGIALIGKSCRKIPLDNDNKKNICNHYSIECDRNGVINLTGQIIYIGNDSYEELTDRFNFNLY